VLTYDVAVERVNKVRKILKKYLTWTQNSVFEGEIAKGKLDKCLGEIEETVDKEYDSIYIYTIPSTKFISKNVLGDEKNLDELFL
jgi:CRISPR-associated protein Cas2